MKAERVEVTSADIARIAEVKPTAVSNWRRRHDDFPKPVGGTDRSPRFDLAEVEAWLKRQGKALDIPAEQRLWQALESQRDELSLDAALGLVGTVLLHLSRHPGTDIPATGAGAAKLMADAARTFVGLPGTGPGIPALAAPSSYGEPAPRQFGLLSAAAESAATEGAEKAFGLLCGRFLDSGPRAGFISTPPELAALMVSLASPPSGAPDGPFLDPACGSGTLLLAAAHHGYRQLHGQDLNPSLARLTALRLAFRAAGDTAGAADDTRAFAFDLHADDFLRRPVFPRGSAAAIAATPPFAERNWGYEELIDSPSWKYGLPPRTESELAWVQHALSHAAPGGRVVLLLPPAVAARPSGRRIRAELLRRGALRAVISLPPGFAAHYALALQLWVLQRPAGSAPTPTGVLFVDTDTTTDRRDTGQVPGSISPPQSPTGVEIHALVGDIWAEYTADPGGFATRPGVARTVPVIDLLDGETDLTPRRHLPLPARPEVSAHRLKATRTELRRALDALRRAVPQPPSLPGAEADLRQATGPDRINEVRVVSLGELAKSGAVFLRRPSPPSPSETRQEQEADEPGGRGEAHFLTGRDITLGRRASGTGPAPADTLHLPPIRTGDVLIPTVTGRIVARVATEEDAGAYPGHAVHLIRPDPGLLDPWYLAGYLSSSTGHRHAVTATSGRGSRIDPRRLRIPLLPLAQQKAYGEAFRQLAEFTRALRGAYDLGQDFARHANDALAAALGQGTDGPGPPQ